MMEDGKNLVGICGLYCGSCPNYLAPRVKDTEELNNIASAKEMQPDEVRCDGCLSDFVMPDCVTCRHGFRACAEEHGVTWCFQCAEYPCQRLDNFSKIHIVNGICHHANIIPDLAYLKERGINAWIEKKEKESCCPECGQKLYWFALECPYCKAVIKVNLLKGKCK